jgi:tetratricopeptide (TPR) repeat protein
MRILTINALDHKGMALAKTGNASEAINAYDQALVLLAAFPLPELGFLVSGITQRKGLALIQNQNPSEAVAAFDRIVTRFRENKDLSAAGVVSALISKAIVLHQIESTLSEDDFLLLLECMAQEDKLRPGFMEVLAQVVSRLGPFKALELIQASPAAPLFLPLVTALQREIGQETHVAREIDEVAEDIRQLLERLRHDPQIGRTFLPDELTIRTTSTST